MINSVPVKIQSRYAKFAGKAVKKLYVTLQDGISLRNGDTIVLNPSNTSEFTIERKREVIPYFPYNNA